MDQAEFEALVVAQDLYLRRIGPSTRLTIEILCRMHRDWLGDIYDWAGRYRTVELAKGGFRWPPAFRVAQNMGAFEKGVLARCTPCRPGPLPEVARCLAEVHAELLLIHPFREGNGRLARWLSDVMAFQAGLPGPNYGFVDRGARKRRVDYLEAVKKGYMQDYEPLTAFFVEAFERRLRGRPAR
jgi:cell filamentation protein